MLKKKLFGFLVLAPFLVAPLGASAVPVLQLDIDGGVYDDVTETIVTSDGTFTLYVLGTPEGNVSTSDLLGTTFYVSIALTPQSGPGAVDFGSFEFNGTTYTSADMTYGVPPIEADGTAAHDGGDLGQHDVFQTFFAEVAFTFDPADVSGTYNTADDPGGPISGSGSYFAAFSVDVSGLAAGFGLHFDAYSKQPGQSVPDLDTDLFAPFSHDAAFRPGNPIPEPSAALVFGAALLVTGCTTRRRAA
jgi:hypothetical protein